MIGKSKVYKDNIVCGIRERKGVSHVGEHLLDQLYLDKQRKDCEFWANLDDQTKLIVNKEFTHIKTSNLNAFFDSEMTASF